jgi:hypothetical protein
MPPKMILKNMAYAFFIVAMTLATGACDQKSAPPQPAVAVETNSTAKPTAKKATTAEEIALDPAAAGFKKGGSMVTTYVDGHDAPVDEQWMRDNPDGTVDVLSMRTMKGKLIGANLKTYKK